MILFFFFFTAKQNELLNVYIDYVCSCHKQQPFHLSMGLSLSLIDFTASLILQIQQLAVYIFSTIPVDNSVYNDLTIAFGYDNAGLFVKLRRYFTEYYYI